MKKNSCLLIILLLIASCKDDIDSNLPPQTTRENSKKPAATKPAYPLTEKKTNPTNQSGSLHLPKENENSSTNPQPTGKFLTQQKKYQRVREAIEQKRVFLEKKLNLHQLTLSNLNLLLVAYKEEGLLSVYVKSKQATTYKPFNTYSICSSSGNLGPKRKQGDLQVPEGFYHINRFNPVSNFHLSLGINYPNLSDKIKSDAANLGGDIFIHGSCVTIGCLPLTDNFIKEVYLLAIHAKNNGQHKIPVYVFPFKMTDQNFLLYKIKYKDIKKSISFWRNLKVGYDKFIQTTKELNVSVSDNGDYLFTQKND